MLFEEFCHIPVCAPAALRRNVFLCRRDSRAGLQRQETIAVQLDLFAGEGAASAQAPQTTATLNAVDAAALGDLEILAAIPNAGIPLVFSLIEEAGRRRLPEAIPVLAVLCRRFAGFGIEREVREQAAALLVLASIGGQDARAAVSGLLEGRVVQGPTRKVAARVAVTLRCRLSVEIHLALLRHADPEMRAIACGLPLPRTGVDATLIGLLTDLDANVRAASACALGRSGRSEAMGVLKNILRRAPTQAVIEAIAPIADQECIVLLGRLARTQTALKDMALEALAQIDDPMAVKLTDALPSRKDLS
jgi:hypothetical protein